MVGGGQARERCRYAGSVGGVLLKGVSRISRLREGLIAGWE